MHFKDHSRLTFLHFKVSFHVAKCVYLKYSILTVHRYQFSYKLFKISQLLSVPNFYECIAVTNFIMSMFIHYIKTWIFLVTAISRTIFVITTVIIDNVLVRLLRLNFFFILYFHPFCAVHR